MDPTYCPFCGKQNIKKTGFTADEADIYVCKDCKKRFELKTDKPVYVSEA